MSEGASQAGIEQRWRVLALLCAIFALASIDRQIIGLLQEPIKHEFALSDGQLGLMTGFAFAIFYTTLSLPAARLVDRGANRTILLALALSVWSVMTALCGIATSYAQLLLARAGVGVGEAGCSPPSLTLISDYFPRRERGLAMGIFSLGIPLGSMIGLIGGGWAAQHFGWRGALLLVGLPGLLLALAFKLTVREPPRGMAEGRAAAPLPSAPLRDVAKCLLAKPTYIHLILGASLAAFCSVGVLVWFPAFFMRSYHVGLAEVGLWWGLIAGVAGIGGSFAGGWLSDRFARRNPAFMMAVPGAAMLLSIPLSLLALTADGWNAALGLLVIPAFLLNLWIAPTMALTQTLAPLQMRGLTGASIAFFTNMIGPGLGPLILGTASDMLGRSMASDVEGLRWALILSTGVSAWSALHFFLGGRSVGRDLESVEGPDAG